METLTMILGCFGSTIVLAVMSRYLPDASPVEGAVVLSMAARRARPAIKPFPCAECNQMIHELPANTRLMHEGDPLDGWYFEHCSKSTHFIPIGSSKILA